jgi:hypothetical protein
MKPLVCLRIAAVLTFVHAVLHTVGGVFGKPGPGPERVAVSAMKANQFILMGNPRTFWDFYMGMGLCVSIFLTVAAIVFWQLSSISRTDSLRLRPIYAAFLVGFLALALNSWRYFFPAPVVVEILIAACLGVAIFSSKPVPADR